MAMTNEAERDAMSWLRKQSEMPRPTKPLQRQVSGDQLMIPFQVAEACRTTFAVLAKSESMPEALREWMKLWLEGYDDILAEWISSHCGPLGLVQANHIHSIVYANMKAAVHAAYENAEGDAFVTWEQEMGPGRHR
jgi:hypothetical protein